MSLSTFLCCNSCAKEYTPAKIKNNLLLHHEKGKLIWVKCMYVYFFVNIKDKVLYPGHFKTAAHLYASLRLFTFVVHVLIPHQVRKLHSIKFSFGCMCEFIFKVSTVNFFFPDYHFFKLFLLSW